MNILFEKILKYKFEIICFTIFFYFLLYLRVITPYHDTYLEWKFDPYHDTYLEWKFDWDFYRLMYNDITIVFNRENPEVIAPFCYRILTPLVVRLFPFEDMTLNWGLYSFIFIYLTGIVLYFIFRIYFNKYISMVGLILFCYLCFTSPTIPSFGDSIYDYYFMQYYFYMVFHVDPLAYFLLMLCFYSILKSNKKLFCISLLLGILTKESILFTIPVYLIHEYLKRRKIKNREKSIYNFLNGFKPIVPTILIFILMRIIITPKSSLEEVYWDEYYQGNEYMSLGMIEVLLKYLISDYHDFGWGILDYSILFWSPLLFILFCFNKKKDVFNWFKLYSVFIAAIYFQMMIAGERSRALFFGFFPILLLAVSGVNNIYEIIQKKINYRKAKKENNNLPIKEVLIKKEELIPLDPISQSQLFFKHPILPEVLYGAVILRGKLKLDVLNNSYKKVMEKNPHLHDILIKKRVGVFYKIFRKPIQPLPIGEINLVNSNLPYRERLLEHFKSSLSKHIDPFREPTFYAYYVKLDENIFAIAYISHHTTLDGIGFVNFYQELFSYYYKEIYKKESEWSKSVGFISLRDKKNEGNIKMVPLIKPRFSIKKTIKTITVFLSFRKARKFTINRPLSELSHANLLKIEKNTLKKIKQYGKSLNSTVNDVLLALLFRTLFIIFPEIENKKKTHYTISVPINIKKKISPNKRIINNMTSLFISIEGSQFRNVEKILKIINTTKKKQIEMGLDIYQYHVLRILLKITQLFPFNLSRKLFHKLFQFPFTSLFSNFGILWPEIVDGGVTGKSFLTKIGDELEILDVDLGYSLLPHIGHEFVTFTYREQLHIYLSTYDAFFSKEQSKRFIDVFHQEIEKLSNKKS